MARRVLLQTSSIQGVFRVDFCPVVTNVVNPSAFSVKMLVFGLRLTTFVTEVLARRFELRWFDDVCNVGCPLVARPGLAAAHGCRSQAQVLWLAYGSARQTARSSETAIAFACACMRGIETAITFAGEKRAILVQFPGAKVSLVSMVAVRGRAVVPAVSCWPASVAAEVSLVSKLARGRVLCAQKFALLGPMVGVSAKKFAQRTKNGPKMAFSGVLGELFRGNADGGGVLGCNSGAGSRRIPPRITSTRVTRGRGYCPG